MNAKAIDTFVGSYKARMMRADEKAIKAIREGAYETAAMLVAESAGYKAAIAELEFIGECMEVEA